MAKKKTQQAADKKKKYDKPSCFHIQVSVLVFPHEGNMFESNEQVAGHVRELFEESMVLSDFDDLEVTVKNDNDADWDD